MRPGVTDWLMRTCSRSSRRCPGVQRVTVRGRPPIAMRVWIDPDRLAALNLAPGRRARGAAAQQLPRRGRPDEGRPGPDQPAREHRPALGREFEDLIVAERGRRDRAADATSRASSSAPKSRLVAKYNDKESVYLGVWPLVGTNEIDVAHRLRAEMERMRPTLPATSTCSLAYDGTVFMRTR
jgi:multidrug efflux pump